MLGLVYKLTAFGAAAAACSYAWAGPVSENYPGAAYTLVFGGIPVKGISGVYDASETFTNAGGKPSVVSDAPLRPQDVPNTNNVAASQVNFWSVLSAFGGGWSFVLGGHLSNGSLQV
jgi:hypothetical protein